MKGLSKFGPGGMHLVFDPADPDTPCMVYLRQVIPQASATFWCAIEEGEIEGCELSEAQMTFLDSHATEAEAFDDAVRRKEE